MEIALTVLDVVAPVFLLAGIGYIWVWLGFEYRIQFVTRLAMSVSVPALMFTALMKTEIEPQALSAVSLAALAAYGAISLIMWLVVRLADLEIRTYLAPLIFGNTGNLGLPLALFAFGQEGLGYAVVIFAIMAVWSFTFGIWLVSGGGSPLRVMREPLVLATLAGALFLWQGWRTPVFLTSALDLVGQMAIPLMLITLGVSVARLRAAHMSRALGLAVIKVGLTAFIGWATGRAFGLEAVPLAVLIVQVSTPVAVTSYLLAEKYDADSEAVAGLVVVSTLVSVATIPLILAFLI